MKEIKSATENLPNITLAKEENEEMNVNTTAAANVGAEEYEALGKRIATYASCEPVFSKICDEVVAELECDERYLLINFPELYLEALAENVIKNEECGAARRILLERGVEEWFVPKVREAFNRRAQKRRNRNRRYAPTWGKDLCEGGHNRLGCIL